MGDSADELLDNLKVDVIEVEVDDGGSTVVDVVAGMVEKAVLVVEDVGEDVTRVWSEARWGNSEAYLSGNCSTGLLALPACSFSLISWGVASF